MQDTLHACILHACTLAPTLRLPTRRPQPHSQLLATRRPQPQPCAPLVHHTPTRPPIDSLDRLQRAATAAALPSSPCVYASCAPLATQPNLCCGCPASLSLWQPSRLDPSPSVFLCFLVHVCIHRAATVHPACRHILTVPLSFACSYTAGCLAIYQFHFIPAAAPVHFSAMPALDAGPLFPISPIALPSPLFPLPGEQHCRPPICQADPGFTRCCLV